MMLSLFHKITSKAFTIFKPYVQSVTDSQLVTLVALDQLDQLLSLPPLKALEGFLVHIRYERFSKIVPFVLNRLKIPELTFIFSEKEFHKVFQDHLPTEKFPLLEGKSLLESQKEFAQNFTLFQKIHGLNVNQQTLNDVCRTPIILEKQTRDQLQLGSFRQLPQASDNILLIKQLVLKELGLEDADEILEATINSIHQYHYRHQEAFIINQLGTSILLQVVPKTYQLHLKKMETDKIKLTAKIDCLPIDFSTSLVLSVLMHLETSYLIDSFGFISNVIYSMKIKYN